MKKPVQLLVPLELPEHRIELPADDEREVVRAVAILLLQILGSGERREVEDDLEP